jgi:hypothetical protein
MMFGDFLQTFGLDFPLQAADAQGGLFGLNAPTGGQPSSGSTPPAPGGAGTGLNMTQPVTGGGAKAPPGVTAPGNNMQPVAAPQAATSPSPLASPLAAGSFGQPQNQADNSAPAAGVGNQFSGKAGF